MKCTYFKVQSGVQAEAHMVEKLGYVSSHEIVATCYPWSMHVRSS